MVVLVGQQAEASASFYSYETRTNTIDDGDKVLTRLEERKSDSLSPETIRQKLIVGPSKLRAAHNNWINRQQLRTNLIGTGLERASIGSSAFEKLFNRYNNNNDNSSINNYRSGNQKRQRGFISKARTVESPALSVDSGGQKLASISLAHEMAKFLDVERGHYADIYNQIDRVNLPTKRPADPSEDSKRTSVVNIFRKH